LKLVKVRRYIAELTAAAVRKAERETGRCVATLAETLAYCTRVMELGEIARRTRLADFMGYDGEFDIEKLKKAPPGYVHKLRIRSTTDEKGQVYATHEAETITPALGLTAAQILVRHYDSLDIPPPPSQKTVNVMAVLSELPTEQLRALNDRLKARAIDVPSLPVGGNGDKQP
jgi:hypothetical protein